MLIQPSQADVRRFFCTVYQKYQTHQPLQAIEEIAARWIQAHEQYHAQLADVQQALQSMHTVHQAQDNPFLHLSMHVSVSEQCSIDQPRGIRRLVERLSEQKNSLHEAHHIVMQYLGDMIWQSQRSGKMPDASQYLADIERHLTKD